MKVAEAGDVAGVVRAPGVPQVAADPQRPAARALRHLDLVGEEIAAFRAPVQLGRLSVLQVQKHLDQVFPALDDVAAGLLPELLLNQSLGVEAGVLVLRLVEQSEVRDDRNDVRLSLGPHQTDRLVAELVDNLDGVFGHLVQVGGVRVAQRRNSDNDVGDLQIGQEQAEVSGTVDDGERVDGLESRKPVAPESQGELQRGGVPLFDPGGESGGDLGHQQSLVGLVEGEDDDHFGRFEGRQGLQNDRLLAGVQSGALLDDSLDVAGVDGPGLGAAFVSPVGLGLSLDRLLGLLLGGLLDLLGEPLAGLRVLLELGGLFGAPLELLVLLLEVAGPEVGHYGRLK